jgi:hypothetical protein
MPLQYVKGIKVKCKVLNRIRDTGSPQVLESTAWCACICQKKEYTSDNESTYCRTNPGLCGADA